MAYGFPSVDFESDTGGESFDPKGWDFPDATVLRAESAPHRPAELVVCWFACPLCEAEHETVSMPVESPSDDYGPRVPDCETDKPERFQQRVLLVDEERHILRAWWKPWGRYKAREGGAEDQDMRELVAWRREQEQ